jgi:tRNA 5-methylaminomethyl-2-thiouridine biosynthesis bifunctional protein
MQALIDRQQWPADWVQALDAAQAGARAGLGVPSPAWFYPGGGWVAPAALVAHWLAADGVRFVGGRAVQRLAPGTEGWQLFDADGQRLAQAPVIVLANAAGVQRLLAPWRCAWPLQRVRGQVSGWSGDPTPLRLPLAGDGYALPGPQGGVLCGATSALDDDDPGVRSRDHEENFRRLQRLTGLQPPVDRASWQGRVGWRLQADDRLPIAGSVPQPEATGRRDQARLWPRIEGLFVCTALGGRGITLAPLLGRLLAAQISGSPLPLERDLVDAVDPARFRVRAARRETAR